jgi:hypothetical protein
LPVVRARARACTSSVFFKSLSCRSIQSHPKDLVAGAMLTFQTIHICVAKILILIFVHSALLCASKCLFGVARCEHLSAMLAMLETHSLSDQQSQHWQAGLITNLWPAAAPGLLQNLWRRREQSSTVSCSPCRPCLF